MATSLRDACLLHDLRSHLGDAPPSTLNELVQLQNELIFDMLEDKKLRDAVSKAKPKALGIALHGYRSGLSRGVIQAAIREELPEGHTEMDIHLIMAEALNAHVEERYGKK